MNTSTSGRALITDFDGTLVRLAVDWAALRVELGVTRVGELWARRDVAWMERVAAVEREGAERGAEVPAGLAHVRHFDRFAVLTDNAESAVLAFLDRRPGLSARCVVVAGRETLRGPKADRDIFRRGVDICTRALALAGAAPLAYLGDSDRELALARELELEVVDVASLPGDPAGGRA